MISFVIFICVLILVLKDEAAHMWFVTSSWYVEGFSSGTEYAWPAKYHENGRLEVERTCQWIRVPNLEGVAVLPLPLIMQVEESLNLFGDGSFFGTIRCYMQLILGRY